jgi:hypothetical protein
LFKRQTEKNKQELYRFNEMERQVKVDLRKSERKTGERLKGIREKFPKSEKKDLRKICLWIQIFLKWGCEGGGVHSPSPPFSPTFPPPSSFYSRIFPPS